MTNLSDWYGDDEFEGKKFCDACGKYQPFPEGFSQTSRMYESGDASWPKIYRYYYNKCKKCRNDDLIKYRKQIARGVRKVSGKPRKEKRKKMRIEKPEITNKKLLSDIIFPRLLIRK